MRKSILFILIPLIMFMSGCGMLNKNVIYPIEKVDIISVEKGDEIAKKDGTKIKVEKNGWYLSDFYMNEVVDAKVK